MSPFEALYAVKPRQFCIPTEHKTTNVTVEVFQIKREAMNALLQEAIQQTQHKYKLYADKKQVDKEFKEGD